MELTRANFISFGALLVQCSVYGLALHYAVAEFGGPNADWWAWAVAVYFAMTITAKAVHKLQRWSTW